METEAVVFELHPAKTLSFLEVPSVDVQTSQMGPQTIVDASTIITDIKTPAHDPTFVPVQDYTYMVPTLKYEIGAIDAPLTGTSHLEIGHIINEVPHFASAIQHNSITHSDSPTLCYFIPLNAVAKRDSGFKRDSNFDKFGSGYGPDAEAYITEYSGHQGEAKQIRSNYDVLNIVGYGSTRLRICLTIYQNGVSEGQRREIG